MYKKVNCRKIFNVDVDSIWLRLKNFSNDWHPAVKNMIFEKGSNGSLIRRFNTHNDLKIYREQLTYLSNTDHELRYKMLEGIEGVEVYEASISVKALGKRSIVNWKAHIEGDVQRLNDICEGTKQIFKQGLKSLLEVEPEVESTVSPKTEPAKIQKKIILSKPKIGISVSPSGVSQSEVICIFLHGIGGNRRNWDSQLKALGFVVPCVSIDLRGYGDSQLGSNQSDILSYCQDILEVMKEFKAKKIILCGLSYGSWIAASFAMRHGDLLIGLVLSGGCTGMSEAGLTEREAFRNSREVPLDQGKEPKDFAKDVVDIIAGPNSSLLNRDILLQSMYQISAKTYRDALRCFTNPTEKLDFSKICCPVLLMTGEYDKLAPPNEIRAVSNRMHADNIRPDIQFEVLAEAGHVCNLEAGDDFNKLVIKFMNQVLICATNLKYVPKESRKRDKKRRILNSALKEFSKNGFSGSSMECIANRAGVSKPTLYKYFGNKTKLLSAVLNIGTFEILAPLQDRNSNGLVQTLWNFSWSYAKFVLRSDTLSLARLIIGEAERDPSVAQEYQESGPLKALSGIFDYLQIQKNMGMLDFDDIELTAQSLWTLILSAPREFHLHNPNAKVNEELIVKYINHGLKVFIQYYSLNSESDLKELEGLFVNFKNNNLV